MKKSISDNGPQQQLRNTRRTEIRGHATLFFGCNIDRYDPPDEIVRVSTRKRTKRRTPDEETRIFGKDWKRKRYFEGRVKIRKYSSTERIYHGL